MIILIISALVIALDQYSKQWAVEGLSQGSIIVIDGFFDLTYVQNTGAAFGLFQNGKAYFLILTPAIMIALLLYVIAKQRKNRWVNLSAALIIGGAIGNYIDRIRLGYVIDFLDFKIWPVFNIADSSIVLGTAIYAYYVFFIGDKEGKREE